MAGQMPAQLHTCKERRLECTWKLKNRTSYQKRVYILTNVVYFGNVVSFVNSRFFDARIDQEQKDLEGGQLDNTRHTLAQYHFI